MAVMPDRLLRPTDHVLATKVKLVIELTLEEMRAQLQKGILPTEGDAAAVEKLSRAMMTLGGPDPDTDIGSRSEEVREHPVVEHPTVEMPHQPRRR